MARSRKNKNGNESKEGSRSPSTDAEDQNPNPVDPADTSDREGDHETDELDEEELDDEEYEYVDEDDEDADEEYEEEEEEFTLDKLSEAYAKVLDNSNPGTPESGEPDPENESVSKKSKRESKSKPTPAVKEVDDDAACPVSPESILEAILFVGSPRDVKLTSRNIAALMRNVSPKEVTAIAKSLNKKYESENAAYRVRVERGVMQMVLDSELTPVQNHVLGRFRTVRLSQQAIDVLAVIAYNQPVTRAEIDRIRARSSQSVIRQMVRRGLVYEDPDNEGPAELRTTDRFLDLFGLEEIDDLPRAYEDPEALV